MLELRESAVCVVACVADPAACDAVEALGARMCRVASDEVLVVGDAGGASATLVDVTARATHADADAVVVDATDGWAVWTIEGEVGAALSRLSAVEVPEAGFAQGDVARVPVKLLAEPGLVHLLVPAMWRDYLRERILARCATMGVQERAL